MNRSEFFSVENAQRLYNISYKFILKQIDYEIGDNGEDKLLAVTMERIAVDNSGEDLKELNKKALLLFTDIIIKKISSIREEEYAKRAKEPMETEEFPEVAPVDDTEEIPDDIDIPSQEREHNIIEEPEELKKYNEEEKDKLLQEEYIVVDSRDRDYSVYPEPNKFRFVFAKPFFTVISIELLTAELPISQYNVNNSNNLIYFQETGALNITIATVPPGNYTSIASLASAIETAMNNASGTGAVFTVNTTTYALQNKVVVSSDLGGSATLFNLLFDSGDHKHYHLNSIGPVLGFKIGDKVSSNNYTSDYPYDLEGEQYVILQMENIKNINSTNPLLHNGFAKIPMSTTDGKQVKYFTANSDYNSVKKFRNPLSSLDYLDISFNSYSGLYDFNGLNVSLTFKIVYLNVVTS